MDEPLRNYRADLVKAEQKSQEDFDKTVLALSSGALGVSFVFVTDIIGDGPTKATWSLIASWSSWAVSVTSVLFSYFFSHLSLRKAIEQVDKGDIRSSHPGGSYDRITAGLNVLGAILFLVGVIFIAAFAFSNIGGI